MIWGKGVPLEVLCQTPYQFSNSGREHSHFLGQIKKRKFSCSPLSNFSLFFNLKPEWKHCVRRSWYQLPGCLFNIYSLTNYSVFAVIHGGVMSRENVCCPGAHSLGGAIMKHTLTIWKKDPWVSLQDWKRFVMALWRRAIVRRNRPWIWVHGKEVLTDYH